MLIFDLDGTLWETTKTTYEATNMVADMYEEVNHVSMNTVIKGMGLSKYENAKNYFPNLPEEKALKYLKERSNINMELIKKNKAYLYDGMIDTIKDLSKKYKLAIVTNSSDDYAKTFIDVSGLNDYFTDYLGAATYGITKAEAIKKIVEKYNEPDSFYIGDIKKDMDSAIEAGIRFIHARYGFEKDVDSKYYINDIRELAGVLDEIK